MTPARLTPGTRFILGFHLLNIALWFLGQTMAVFAYDTVAGWGLQDPRALIDPAIVEVNRGIGLADTVIMLRLFGTAFVELLRMKYWGAISSWLAFGISLYWPVVFWSCQFFYGQGGIRHNPTQAVAIAVPAFFLGFAVWGSWYLFRIRDRFA